MIDANIMQNLFFIPIIAIGIVIGIFIILIKRRDVPHQFELGKKPKYSEISGGRFGLFKYSWPFVRFAVYDDFLIISHWSKIMLTFDEISKIDKGRFQFSSGIRICHSRSDIPAKIIIWTSHADEIEKAIGGKVTIQ